MFSQRRIARLLAALLAITILQGFSGMQAPSAFAAPGSVGPATASGTCASSVGETTYVTATFTASGFCLLQVSTSTTWTVPTGVTAIDILLVGGGGGGGSDGGGGGGGGEVRQATGISVSAGASASITVGTGGIGNIHGQTNGTNGNPSSLVINGTTYSANGGLKSVNWQSAAYYAPGGSGGSGGTQLTGGTDFSKGGRNSIQTPGYTTGFGTVGYDGVSTSFTGTSIFFAGGGGGGICTNNKADPNFGGLAGGQGGGGRGSLHTQNVGSDAGQPGTNGLGGGGGGGAACNDGGIDGVNARTAGGRGGDGVVYIKFVPAITFSATPSSQNVAVGSSLSLTATPTGTVSGPTRTKQWQVLVPGGSWTNISGATSDTYSLGTIVRSINGNQYRYVVTDTLGTLVSQSITTPVTVTTFLPYQGETDTALGPGASNLNYASLNYAGTEIVKPSSSDAFTVEAWIHPTDTCTASNCGILGREENYLLTWEAGELRFIVWNSTSWGQWQYTGVNLPLNQWSHVALSKSSSTWNLYVNAALVYSASLTYAPSSSTSWMFFIGNRSGGSYPFKGYIDEVKMWRSTRSASDIATDMNRTVTNDANLYAYWNFNEGVGTKAYNQVPGVSEDTDLTMYASDLWNSSSIMTRTTSGAYTVVTFKRSILNLVGGWRSPSGINRVSIVAVAGGGGGGGGINGGGGGAGGFIETTTSVTQSSYYQIYVGAGGVGSQTQTYAATAPSNGTNSTALSLTAIGGGYGGSEYYSPNSHYAPASGGSGGGGSWGGNGSNRPGGSGTSGQGNKGGDNVSNCCFGAGGGGASAPGVNTTASTPGAGGAGSTSLILGAPLAGGGGGSNRGPGTNVIGTGGAGGAGGGGAGASSSSAKPNTTNGPQSGSANTGGGGGAGVMQGGNSDGRGAQGGSGVVAIRWITAAKPTYTAPTISYHNVGMTETFTTNVAQDSATVSLTRTFRWESSTTGVNGAYSVIKQGTGANNAFFAWIPTNTSTSGSTYAYRVIVTDSDTLGLFIVDTSTPVWAVINPALNVSGNTNIGKAINLARSETFTITLGTPTYRATLTPDAPGISLDTSTAGFAVIRIADTATVGTYYETLTVTDSVSASVVTPLTITVSAPPSLVNTSEIVDSGLIFNLDFANSASFNRSTRAASDISGSKKSVTLNNNPVFSEENLGYMKMTAANSQYITASGFSTMSKWSIDTFFRLDSTSQYTCIVTGEATTSNATRNLGLCIDATTARIYAGFHNGTYWTYVRTQEQIPVNTWTHVVAQWDGLTSAAQTSVKIWINGVQGTNYEWYTGATSASPASSNRIFINHDPVTASSSYTNLSLGYVRIYDRALSASEVTQNFNATKSRFLAENISATYPSQKYGSSHLETFTATAGYGARTTSFAVGDRTGIDWDTTTVTNQVRLSIQESLTVGTYNDTVTVTDSLGQSTFLPIRVTVSKADTITVTLRNPKVLTFTGSPAASLPDIGITGLKSSDTATVTRLFSAPASGVGAPETYTALINSSTVPTNVESYTVSLSAINFTVGSLSNYEGVTYETSTLKILQADQPDLRVPPYGAYVGAPYTIVVEGGAGGGAVTESVTSGSTATGCSITNDVLTITSTTQGYCNVLITKAQSRNYKSETLTVQIYFYSLVISQPSPEPGSGPNIALTGQTSVTLDPYQAPTISSLSATTISLSAGGSITITGAGFTTSPITVKFWRNKEVTVTSTNGTTLVIPFSAIAAAGATTGRIIVTTPNGQAVSVDTLTINP